ncbi:hypothetical protein Agub_g9113, partial [Astrephomene gubernaculifera]
MCVVCWQEFDDCSNPPVDLGCGHFGCVTCRAAIERCPVCHAAVAASPNSRKSTLHELIDIKQWPTPRRRWRLAEGQGADLGDLLDDDHLAPLTLGSADEAVTPRLRMLERVPSSASGSMALRPPNCVAVSAGHLVHGGFVVGRTVVFLALVPTARLGLFITRTVLFTTLHAATGVGHAIAHVATRLARFALAPRYSIIGFDGSKQHQHPQLCSRGHSSSSASDSHCKPHHQQLQLNPTRVRRRQHPRH